jgi:hypothetical protein
LFGKAGIRPSVLSAIVDLGGDTARAAISEALAGPIDGTICRAIEIVEGRTTEDWSPQVLATLHHADPNGDLPEPNVWIKCASYLLRRDPSNAEVKAGLAKLVKRNIGDAAVLALEFAPGQALMLFRRALRSSVPDDRNTAAAALAVLDQPWSRAELVAVLAECDEQEPTSEVRAALRLMSDPQLHEVVADWETANPHERSPERFVRVSEAALAWRNSWMNLTMQKLHGRVLPLRNRMPDLSPGG